MVAEQDWTTILGTVLGSSLFGALARDIVHWLRGAKHAAALAVKTEADAVAVLRAAVNEQVKTLIDGYERRVLDLTNEVHALREENRQTQNEVIALRKALDARRGEERGAGFGM